jgi:hypothetical protein
MRVGILISVQYPWGRQEMLRDAAQSHELAWRVPVQLAVVSHLAAATAG